MSSIKLFQKLKKKESSDDDTSESKAKAKAKAKVKAKAKERKRLQSHPRYLQFDLFALLTYMSAISSARVSRSELFKYASQLPYSSAQYFRNVYILAEKLNIDYAEGCRLVAERTEVDEVKSLLLRLAGALTSGEDEGEFLMREAEAMGELYGNRYERDVESLKKWTDAYVTLVVASSLIVIVSVISMMIYNIGTTVVVGLAMTMVFVTILGGWIIYISAPKEIVTRVRGPSSKLQKRGMKLFKILMPTAFTIAAVMVLKGVDLGWVFIMFAVFLVVPGWLFSKDDRVIAKKDFDMATAVRVLGGVTSAIGTTVAEALNQIDRRSLGAVTPEMTVLMYRLGAGINPKTCWNAFVDEVGSELVDRTVFMFTDAINLGGDAGRVGIASSVFASKIAFLRATRGMVAATFRWLILPLHGAMIGLLQFIPEIMGLFSLSITESAEMLSDNTSLNSVNSNVPIGEIFTFGQINLDLVNFLVTFVTIVLTLSNAYAPKAADGGNNIKIAYNLSIMMTITGILMIVVPMAARGLFKSIIEGTP
ncbi:MAG: archaellar assembly protein FlaJ [Chloroflexi bacterium]|nr:archaellar assembly protein FlaJ [Chloroflexota bacterium]